MELAELRLGRLDPPPFLLSVLFTVINPGFRVLAAARMLGAVHKGRWSDDDRTYVPSFRRDLLGGADAGPLWSMLVRGGGDMGDVCLVGQGARVLRISFVMPWPRAVRIGGSHFLPEACRLERTGPDACRRTNTPAPLVRTPATDVAHLTYAHEAWVRRMGNLPAELVAILEGRYCICMRVTFPVFRPLHSRLFLPLHSRFLDHYIPAFQKWGCDSRLKSCSDTLWVATFINCSDTL